MSKQITNITAVVTDGALQSVERNGAFVSEVDFGDGSGFQEVRLPVNTALRGNEISIGTQLAFDSFVVKLDLDTVAKKTREIEALQERADTLQRVADEAQGLVEPEVVEPTNQ